EVGGAIASGGTCSVDADQRGREQQPLLEAPQAQSRAANPGRPAASPRGFPDRKESVAPSREHHVLLQRKGGKPTSIVATWPAAPRVSSTFDRNVDDVENFGRPYGGVRRPAPNRSRARLPPEMIEDRRGGLVGEVIPASRPRYRKKGPA